MQYTRQQIAGDQFLNSVFMHADVINKPNTRIPIPRDKFDKVITDLQSKTKEDVHLTYNNSLKNINAFIESGVPFERLNTQTQILLVYTMMHYYASRYILAKIKIPLEKINYTFNPEKEYDWEIY